MVNVNWARKSSQRAWRGVISFLERMEETSSLWRRQYGRGIRARSGKRTFAELSVKFLLSEDREDLAEVLKVGLKGGAEDKDIIKVDNDTDFEEVAEDVVHGGFEGSGGIGESEWHHEELVVPEPRAEGGLVSVLLADTDLVEATTKVDLAKILGSTETIKELGNPRVVPASRVWEDPEIQGHPHRTPDMSGLSGNSRKSGLPDQAGKCEMRRPALGQQLQAKDNIIAGMEKTVEKLQNEKKELEAQKDKLEEGWNRTCQQLEHHQKRYRKLSILHMRLMDRFFKALSGRAPSQASRSPSPTQSLPPKAAHSEVGEDGKSPWEAYVGKLTQPILSDIEVAECRRITKKTVANIYRQWLERLPRRNPYHIYGKGHLGETIYDACGQYFFQEHGPDEKKVNHEFNKFLSQIPMFVDDPKVSMFGQLCGLVEPVLGNSVYAWLLDVLDCSRQILGQGNWENIFRQWEKVGDTQKYRCPQTLD
ncbi:hypothetical protein CBR_g932 [Chara braunii]|uniref:Uncharacterized protein n=1 Tax=Chara braunii TaxID=69332 RepID=A0A388KCP4_CHABU|nr:hypothetical protein CBR_g932 [Chara braunii]|eukprot:GBG67809.1 hypothetical protein CBR_g932 [Chara braunii]